MMELHGVFSKLEKVKMKSFDISESRFSRNGMGRKEINFFLRM